MTASTATRRDKSSLCTCIALYFSSTGVDLRAWYDYSVDLFTKRGTSPTHMAAGRTGDTRGKYRTFKGLRRKFESGRMGNVDHVSLCAVPQGSEDMCFDFSIHSSISLKGHHYILAFPDAESPLCMELVRGTVIDSTRFVKVDYGIAYTRPYAKGPVFYALGVIQGLGYSDAERLERDRISKWSHAYGETKCVLGLFRDVYPLNVLNPSHLKAKVGSVTFEQWVASSPDHGILHRATDDLWIWEVPGELEPIQKSLDGTGLLLCR